MSFSRFVASTNTCKLSPSANGGKRERRSQLGRAEGDPMGPGNPIVRLQLRTPRACGRDAHLGRAGLASTRHLCRGAGPGGGPAHDGDQLRRQMREAANADCDLGTSVREPPGCRGRPRRAGRHLAPQVACAAAALCASPRARTSPFQTPFKASTVFSSATHDSSFSPAARRPRRMLRGLASALAASRATRRACRVRARDMVGSGLRLLAGRGASLLRKGWGG